MTPPRILLLEDEADAGLLLARYLERQGYAVHWARDGHAALAALEAGRFDLAVLDVMTPGADGFAVLAALRERYAALPALFLTARAQDEDEIAGLRAGADAYLRKPVALSVVLAHVERALRRAAPPAGEAVGPLRLDREARRAWLRDRPLDLTQSEFQLLAALADRPRKAFSRAELLDALGDPGERLERTVDVHIKNIRLKLGADAGLVKTVRGFGYGLDGGG